MDYQQYLKLFEVITRPGSEMPPYTDKYLEYVKLNYSRMNRWQKTLKLNDDLVNCLKKITSRQIWIIITEPWCGDAAPTIPFLVRLAEQNPLIEYDLQLRDSAPFLIDSYLTNGTKSIPKLIVRDSNGRDLFTWGPRPETAKQLVVQLKKSNTDDSSLKTQLQNWYNNDKGEELQRELLELFSAVPILRA